MTGATPPHHIAVGAALGAGLAFLAVGIEPVKSAAANWDELSIGFGGLLEALSLPLCVSVLGGVLIGALVAHLAPGRGLAILITLYALGWLQGSVFVWEYGTFDGSPIDWSRHAARGWIEALVWVGALAVAALRPDGIRSRAGRIAGIVFALQLASLIGLLVDRSPFPEKPEHRTAEGGLATQLGQLSTERNILLVVLDTFQSDFFEEALEDRAVAAKVPPGFQYFRNATSLFPITQFSLQSIVTSIAVPSRAIYRRWIQQHMKKSIPRQLLRLGYDVRVMTPTPDRLACRSVLAGHCDKPAAVAAANPELAARGIAANDTNAMFASGLFRLMPHFAKHRVYDQGRWQLPPLLKVAAFGDTRISPESRRDLRILEWLRREARAVDGPPSFRLLHFWGTHSPAALDADCAWRDRPMARETTIGTARCVLSRLFDYLTSLEALGVYDDTLIVVVGDHGHGFLPFDPERADTLRTEMGSPSAATPRGSEQGLERYGRGVPLFLVKSFGARNALRTTDRPVSLCDVPASIATALRIPNPYGCESVLGDTPDAERQRAFFDQPGIFKQRRTRRDRIRLDEYVVDGHSWLPESWRRARGRPRSAQRGS